MRIARRTPWLAALIFAALLAPSAGADQEFPPGSLRAEVLGPDGKPDNRAGIHPHHLKITTLVPTEGQSGAAKEIVFAFPPGMGGNPGSVPTCPREVFDVEYCPANTQVGVMAIPGPGGASDVTGIYNLEPAPGELVVFGAAHPPFYWFKFLGRLGPDQTLTMRLIGLPQVPRETIDGPPVSLPTEVEFWGVPADHQSGTSIPRRPFLTMPTRCDGGPLTFTGRFRLWRSPNEWFSSRADIAPLYGCEDLLFDPSVSLRLENPVSDSPTGVDIDLAFAQNEDPDGRAAAQTKSVSLELPAGLALSPSAASKLEACSDAQLGLGEERAATCPPASRIGSVEIAASQLSAPLSGRLYLGQGSAGQRFRLFVVASGAGAEAKLVSGMRSDPVTGRLITTLENLPQISFDRLSMHFDGGSRALFLSPIACGRADVAATFVPHSGAAAVHASDSVQVSPRPGMGCGEEAPFDPTLQTWTSTSRGGKPTSLTAIIGRREGEQLADRFSVAIPPGFSVRLRDTERCTEAGIAALACPASSRIGGAFVAFGAGAAEVKGDVFLTGPYRNRPLGFAMILKAAAGSFDLGSIVVRGVLEVDPVTGQVSVHSDQLPQSLEGIPARIQALGLEIGGGDFLRNPTSCGRKRAQATVVSTAGIVAQPSDEIRFDHCVDLPFRPSLSLALTGHSRLRRGDKPGLRIDVRGRRGDANMRAISISLPTILRFGLNAVNEVCSRHEAQRGNCPEGARVGTVSGRSVLLGQPLKGTLYVVRPEGDGPPDLWASLAAEGMELNLQSRSKVEDGHVVTNFRGLPDMPLSAVSMRFGGGSRGAFSLTRDLCFDGHNRGLAAPLEIEGQNAALRQSRIQVAAPNTCRNG